MENMQDRKELNQREQEQVSGGYGGRKGYYCPNLDCSRYACSVNPSEDGKCKTCGTYLNYGLIPFIDCGGLSF